jgi:lipopolysaccharide/colanic/teichoic acid biosynthesis glycosyltransferase/glycosyltransferase involved in cell wall biosynthesis
VRPTPSIVFAVTHPLTARYLLRGQLRFFAERGWDVTLVCAPGEGLEEVAAREGVRVATVPMAREIAPWSDLLALWRLWRLLRRLRPGVVCASTPKAGLLGMLAARMAGVGVRVYTLRGLRLESARGGTRRLLGWMERLAAGSAHRVICVSESLLRRVLELGLAPETKLRVLGAGSSNGVDALRIGATVADGVRVEGLRRELGLAGGSREGTTAASAGPVIGFVGRLTRDKGVEELGAAFELVRARVADARLLVLGDFEAGDPVSEAVSSRLREDPAVVMAGWVADTAPYYALMDVLAFPSHREGFPNAPLEAAAAAVPTVGFAATGTVDAVVDGVTGRLAPVGDVEAFGAALVEYLEDDELRGRHGAAARRRVVEEFAPERVWGELEREVRGLVGKAVARGALTPAPLPGGEGRGALTPAPGSKAPSWYPAWLKRALDLSRTVPALILLSPVLAGLALIVRWRMGSPVLFRQQRPGLGGRPFTMLKFRTMSDARDEHGELLPDEARLEAIGRFLRRASLDELPALWCVVLGDMSLVGPRPLLMQYLERYSPQQARRHEVKPGITGWAQVNGRNAISWEQKFACDVWYVDHRSLWLDLKILVLTVWKVVRGEGVAAAGHATMPEFRGEGPK